MTRFTGKMLTNADGEECGFAIFDENKRMNINEVIESLNNLNNENIFLARQRDYWKAKFDEGVQTFEFDALDAQIDAEKNEKINELQAKVLNLELDNEILQNKIDWLCEKYDYKGDDI